jgi:nicotinamide phosphoribosyltransferase
MSFLRMIPNSVLSDAYKAGHFEQYPYAIQMSAYGEFRAEFEGMEDERIVFCGMRYIVENYIAVKWTIADVQRAEIFYNTHNVPFTKYPFPKDLFLRIVNENDGYFPVKLQALPEGSIVYKHTPTYQITAGVGTKFNKPDFARLVTFLETILTQVWYPSNVATLSKHTKQRIQEYFAISVDPDAQNQIQYKLHDFGFRGATTVEAAIVGGIAHLLNFEGSDTMPACYYAQFELNNGNPVAMTIPATEHSVMTSWESELSATLNMVDKYGHGVFATVADSFDYTMFLKNVLPLVAPIVKEKGGTHVVRPDSGDPVACVLEALEYCAIAYGYYTNKKGFKVLYNSAVIQGDGINYDIVSDILEAVVSSGWSAQNVSFGMGGGLLQRHNRDTMSMATKLSNMVYADGTSRDIMKTPKTDGGKYSLPGRLKVIRLNGIPTVFPEDYDIDGENELKTVYDCGPIEGVWDKSFEITRKRVTDQWSVASTKALVISEPLQEKISKIISSR